MEIPISCFMPIHNEQKVLPYSLPSVFQLKPDQIIIILDRCTDNSERVIHKLIRKFNYSEDVDVIKIEEKPKDWRWPLSYLVYLAVHEARNEIVFAVGADTLFGTGIERGFKYFDNPEVGWISFAWQDYPLRFESWLKYRIQQIYTKRIPTGINYAFRKTIIEDEVEKLKQLPLAIDFFISDMVMRKGYRRLFFDSNTLHLRPAGPERDYQQGFSKYVFSEGLLQVLFSSCLYFKPLMISGYLKAKAMKLRKYTLRKS